MKFYGGGDYSRASLRRLYDPENEQNMTFNFVGYRMLAENQAILGRVTYRFNSQYHVPYAIEQNPHADDPLVLTDTTTGNIFTDGPAIELAYHIQPWSRLGFGAAVVYEISTGLKEQYTRPRTIHRNFEGRLGLTYQVSTEWVIGSYLNLSYLQDQIELDKSWDGRDIHTIRYRTEQVYRSVVQEFDRYINLDGLWYNFSIQHHRGRLQNVLSLDYVKNLQEVADQTGTVRRMDSYWHQQGYRISYHGRYFLGRMVLAVKGIYLAQEDYSDHPSLPILITERTRITYEIGGESPSRSIFCCW